MQRTGTKKRSINTKKKYATIIFPVVTNTPDIVKYHHCLLIFENKEEQHQKEKKHVTKSRYMYQNT